MKVQKPSHGWTASQLLCNAFSALSESLLASRSQCGSCVLCSLFSFVFHVQQPWCSRSDDCSKIFRGSSVNQAFNSLKFVLTHVFQLRLPRIQRVFKWQGKLQSSILLTFNLLSVNMNSTSKQRQHLESAYFLLNKYPKLTFIHILITPIQSCKF